MDTPHSLLAGLGLTTWPTWALAGLFLLVADGDLEQILCIHKTTEAHHLGEGLVGRTVLVILFSLWTTFTKRNLGGRKIQYVSSTPNGVKARACVPPSSLLLSLSEPNMKVALGLIYVLKAKGHHQAVICDLPQIHSRSSAKGIQVPQINTLQA